MNRRYWDSLASTYESEVQDTLTSDRGGVIESVLDHFASRSAIAADFGCGVGCYSRALSPRFKAVQAFDHSPNCIDEACIAHHDLPNVEFHVADLTQPIGDLARADFGLCMNVLIAPELKLRQAILRTIHSHLRAGAAFILLVPSLESALFTDQRLIDWNIREGMTPAAAIREGFAHEPGFVGHPAGGIIQRGGEPTKHYLREELEFLLRESRFDALEIRKVEYDWSTEFAAPPRWLREPWPWDWLAICRRT